MRVFDYTYIRKWLFGFKLYMVQYLKPIRAYRIYTEQNKCFAGYK